MPIKPVFADAAIAEPGSHVSLSMPPPTPPPPPPPSFRAPLCALFIFRQAAARLSPLAPMMLSLMMPPRPPPPLIRRAAALMPLQIRYLAPAERFICLLSIMKIIEERDAGDAAMTLMPR
jgi:hypothetical protein